MRTSHNPDYRLLKRTLALLAATALAVATTSRVSGDQTSAAPAPTPGVGVADEAVTPAETPRKKPAPPGRSSRSPSTSAFALVGIAGYGERSVALFDGTDPGFKQMLHTGETIGSFTLLTISSNHVELQSETGVVQLALQKQLRMEAGGTWRVQDLATPFTPPNVPPGGTLASTSRSSTHQPDPDSSPKQSSRDGMSIASAGGSSAKELKKAEKEMNAGGKPDKGTPSRKKIEQAFKVAKKIERRSRNAQ